MTRRRRRSGFTLAEVIVVVTLSGFLAIALHRVSTQFRMFSSWQENRMALHDAFRVASAVVAADVREASFEAGDVIITDSTVLDVRTSRGLAFVCATRDAPDAIAVRHARGALAEEVGDSLILYAEGGWRATAVEAGGAGGLACSGGAPAEAVLRLGDGDVESVPIGAPVRSFRRYRYGIATYGGRPWLSRSDGDGTEPLVGPVAADGLRFHFLDSVGGEVQRAGEAAMVEVRMILPFRSTPAGRVVQDTLVARVGTRNR